MRRASWVREVFIEAFAAAVAEGIVSAIGWGVRQWRKRRKKKRKTE